MDYFIFILFHQWISTIRVSFYIFSNSLCYYPLHLTILFHVLGLAFFTYILLSLGSLLLNLLILTPFAHLPYINIFFHSILQVQVYHVTKYKKTTFIYPLIDNFFMHLYCIIYFISSISYCFYFNLIFIFILPQFHLLFGFILHTCYLLIHFILFFSFSPSLTSRIYPIPYMQLHFFHILSTVTNFHFFLLRGGI